MQKCTRNSSWSGHVFGFDGSGAFFKPSCGWEGSNNAPRYKCYLETTIGTVKTKLEGKGPRGHTPAKAAWKQRAATAGRPRVTKDECLVWALIPWNISHVLVLPLLYLQVGVCNCKADGLFCGQITEVFQRAHSASPCQIFFRQPVQGSIPGSLRSWFPLNGQGFVLRC